MACNLSWLTSEFSTTYTEPIQIRRKVRVEQPMVHPDVVIYPIAYRQEVPLESGYASGNMINLRSKPSTKAKIVSKLPLGTPINVINQSKKAKQGTREDHWYKVKASVNNKNVEGYLFGPTINPHKITADFDLDGEMESVYGSYNERKEMLIHYHNPNGKTPYAWTILGRFSNANGISDEAILSVVQAETAGIPLLKISIDCTEHCDGAIWTKYLSFTEHGVRRALELEENETTKTRFQVKFHPTDLGMTLKKHENKTIISQEFYMKQGVYRIVNTPVVSDNSQASSIVIPKTVKSITPKKTALLEEKIKAPLKEPAPKPIEEKGLTKTQIAGKDKTEPSSERPLQAALETKPVLQKANPALPISKKEKPVARITPKNKE